MSITDIESIRTILDPRTVMVHATNATLTGPTMMRQDWFTGLTQCAVGIGAANHRTAGNRARIGQGRLGV
jgi:hypothetical protein